MSAPTQKWYLIKYMIGFLIIPDISKSQVIINEICPSNVSVVSNSSEDYDDWIEIHNSGSSSVNLQGYTLTDDSTKPDQFKFPSYVLNANQKVMVFASDNTNTIIVNHWEMPVNAGSLWKYAAGSASLDTNWRNISFNDNSWNSGYGGIGFGDNDDNTTIPVGISVMMRKTFLIPDTSHILKAALLIDYDDGFVAYLNGVEVARANLGTAGFRPAWDELPQSSHEAMTYRGLPLDSFYIPQNILKSAIRPGSNVLSVEVHNSPATSNDMTSIPYLFFGMKSSATTFNPIPSWFKVPSKEYFSANFKLTRSGESIFFYNSSGTLIDHKLYPPIENDNSYCRIPDGSSNWCIAGTPTPENSNNNSGCYSGYAPSPLFSKQGGYYSSAQTLSITSAPGSVIHYSINGDDPTTSSPVYSSPISISATTTVRAKVFATDVLPSQTVTNTYIINGQTKLPTISITTDSLNLWDYNNGIYVLGPNATSTYPYKGANFWQKWDKPASIEYFDKNKNLVIGFKGEISIFGNYSRAKAQKSFEIKLKDSYGLGSFIYPMYSDKPLITENENIILRNSGTDWNKVHFRDAFMQRMMKNTHSGFLATEPAIMYLNGNYWGVYCIYENHDEHWIKNNFGLKKKEIDYLKESGSSIIVQEGSDETFWSLYNYATTQDPESQEYYGNIDAMLDLKNHTDYFVAETFYNNGDWIGEWTNNIKLWRENKQGSKWKYLLYDLDFGLGLYGDPNDNRLEMARNPIAFSMSSEIFDAVLKNPEYKRYFVNRYADLMNTIYLPSNMNDVMHSIKDSMAFDMSAHFAKWGSNTSSWNSYIESMMDFANARPAIVKNQINNQFHLNGIVTLTLQVQPAGAGRIEINTITPASYPWEGDYFDGNPVTITAIPNPGFEFDYFKSDRVIRPNDHNQSVTYNFDRDDVIKAIFKGSSQTAKLCISEINYNSSDKYNSGDWIELHNYGNVDLDLSGWKLMDENDDHSFIFPTGTVIPENGYLVLIEDSVKFKSRFPTVTNYLAQIEFNFANNGDQLRLFNHSGTLFKSVYYMDAAPWPVLADGDGYTCELKGNTLDPNNGSNWMAGCLGGSPGEAYNNDLNIPIEITGSTTFCSGNSTTLFATWFQNSTYQWKKNGSNIGTATDSVYAAGQAGNYSVSITNNGCNTISPPITLTAVTQQPDPVVSGMSRCGPGEVTLTASSTDSVYWYESANATSHVWVGDTLALPHLTATKTYFVKTGLNCESNPVAVTGTVIPPSAPPATGDTSRCGPGVITLTATDTSEIRWFNLSSGGALLTTGNNFTTNYLESDTSFFVESGSTCPSPRIEVAVRILGTEEPVTADAERCGPGTVTLQATSTNPVYWYSSLTSNTVLGTGTSFTTPSLSATKTYYAAANNGCPSARVPAVAMVNPVPPVPVVSDTTICDAGTITLNASATEQVNWYNNQSGGSSIYTGSNFITPHLTSSKTFYVSNGYQCKSQRIPVTVHVKTTPAPPSVSDVQRCDIGSVTLTASSNSIVSWFDSMNGGTMAGSGMNFTTPSLGSTTTYYAEAGDICRSSRVSATAIILPLPQAPVVTDNARCGEGTLLLEANSNDSIYWYTSSASTTPIATGNQYQTPVISGTTTYFVEARNGCTSPRTEVNAVINAIPNPPVAADITHCGPGSVTLIAQSSEDVNWYASYHSSVPLAKGSTFTTPLLNQTTTYFIESSGNCNSERVPVRVIINGSPIKTVTNGSRCGAGHVQLTASANGELINWYTASGDLAGTGNTFMTPQISATTVYYAEVATCAGILTPVTATIHDSPSVNIGPDTIRIPQGQIITLDAGSGFASYSWNTGSVISHIEVQLEGNYSVTVTDHHGCEATDNIRIEHLIIAKIDELESSVSVYPNPASEKIIVQNNNKKLNNAVIRLMSTDCKILYTDKLSSGHSFNSTVIPLTGLAAGIYYLEICNEDYFTVKKIMVE